MASASNRRRRVILTADDAGLRGDWDGAILSAVRAGLVTAVSLVTNGSTYGVMRRRLQQLPHVDIGVHLNFLEGRALEYAGHFPGSWLRFLSLYFLGRLPTQKILSEWELQIRRAREDGLRPIHLNSHYHLHLLPGLFEQTLGLAQRFDIAFVRVPDEPPWRFIRQQMRPLATAKAAALWLASLRLKNILRSAGMKKRIACLGTGCEGPLEPRAWRRLARRLGPGATEIVCHPGQSGSSLSDEQAASLRAEMGRVAEIVRFRDLD